MSDALLSKAFEAIEAYDDAVYFVGGCLRQLLLQQAIHDYDFVCEASAIALARHLGQVLQAPFFVLDEKRDIARVVLSATDTLDFATLQGNRLSEDLALRDLTINAMAYPASIDLLNGNFKPEHLIDPQGGLGDLKKGLVRGIAEANFISDPLRLLRVFRFAAQHGFTVESRTLDWVKQNAPRLQYSAVERILSELVKILSAPHHVSPPFANPDYSCVSKGFRGQFESACPMDRSDSDSTRPVYGVLIHTSYGSALPEHVDSALSFVFCPLF